MNAKFHDLIALTAIGILLVVIGHSLPSRFDYSEHVDLIENTIKYIFVFHMPLFFYISGYLWFRFNKASFILDLKNKIRRLLIPYFVFTTVAFILKVPMSSFSSRPVEFSFSDFFHGIFFPWSNPVIFYWFLPTLFLVFLITSIVLFPMRNSSITSKTILVFFFFSLFCSLNLFFSVPYRLQDDDFLNLTGVLFHIQFFLFGCLVSCIERKFIFNYYMLFFFFLFSVLSIISYRFLPFAIISLLHLISFCSVNFVSSRLPYLSNCFVILHSGSFFIYLTSYFFQAFIAIVIYHFTNSAYVMFFVSILFGCLGPLVLRHFLLKFKNFKIVFGRFGL